MKKLDFNDGEVPEYEVRSNKQNTTNDNAVLAIESGFPTSVNVPGLTPGPVSKIAESGVYVDLSSPKAEMKNVTMQMQGSASGYGVVFNYVDAENYATIQYDGSKWIAGGKKNGQDVAVDLSAHNIPVIAPDDTRTVRIAKENGVYTLQMSGGAGTAAEEFETYDLGNLDGIYEGAGKVGVVVTEDMTLYVGAITTVYVLEGIEFPVPEEGIIKLESNEMKVLVGESFPSIYTYLNPEEEYLMGTGVTVGNENTNMDILTESGNVTCATSQNY